MGISALTDTDCMALLKANDQQCDQKHQPDFPVLVLRIDDKQYVFNSLYRVWMIESIFSNVLEQKYKAENEQERAQQGTLTQNIEEADDEKREV